jgi:hypothetical protein
VESKDSTTGLHPHPKKFFFNERHQENTEKFSEDTSYPESYFPWMPELCILCVHQPADTCTMQTQTWNTDFSLCYMF